MTLRQRIVLALAPLVCFLAVSGAMNFFQLRQVGDRIEDILRENYVSVEAMIELNDALQRIDFSFQFALQGKEEARLEYEISWVSYLKHLQREEDNITEEGERESVDRLKSLTEEYREKGDRFFAKGTSLSRRREEYFGIGGERGLFQYLHDIQEVAADIRKLNQHSIEQASTKAKQAARISQVGLGINLAVMVGLAALLIRSATRAVLRPIQAVTQSALAIGGGDLNQVVPRLGSDEIGQLAEAFNCMTRQLRYYRQSHSAHLLRVQRTSQATIDSFPDPVLVVDPGGRVEMANPAAHRLLGVSPPPPGEAATTLWLPPESLRSRCAMPYKNSGRS